MINKKPLLANKGAIGLNIAGANKFEIIANIMIRGN
jgi:hypothetical protein